MRCALEDAQHPSTAAKIVKCRNTANVLGKQSILDHNMILL